MKLLWNVISQPMLWAMVGLPAIFLTACGNPATSRQAVIEAMKTPEVQSLPYKSFHFVVRKTDGSVWYVEALSPNDRDLTSQMMLFTAPTNCINNGVK